MTDVPTSDKSTPPIEVTSLRAESSTSQDVIQQQTSVQDYVILRYAVVGLILVALTAILGALTLIGAGRQKDVEAGLTAIIALGGVAVGGLSTMLVRPPLYPAPPAVRMGTPGDRRS